MHSLDIETLRVTVSKIDIWYFTLAIGVLATVPLIAVPRWQGILAALDWPMPYGILTRALYVGAFFSQILPSSVDGDVWRIWHCTRAGVPATTSAYSVLIERFAGVCATLIFFAASFAALMARVGDARLRWVLWTLLIACIGAFVSAIMLGAGANAVSRVRLLYPFAGLAQALASVGRSGKVILIMVVTAIMGQLVASIGYFSLAHSAGAPLSFGQCVATMPPALLIALFPASLGGWGLREGAFIMILRWYGIPAEQALLLSISFGLALLISTLPGLFLWWWQPVGSSSAAIDAALRSPLRSR